MDKEALNSRTAPMQILALGMSRSGTHSVHRALEELGYIRTYHGIRDLTATDDGWKWAELMKRKYGPKPQPILREHFEPMLARCVAVTDMPCAAFWPELLDAYPDAKILLVERDVEAWYRSFRTVVVETQGSWKLDVMSFAMRLGLLPQEKNLFTQTLFYKYFQASNRAEILRNARWVYKQHYDSIEARAKAEGREVLRMRLEEGWDPICKFLDKEKPTGYEDGALPRGNEKEYTAELIRQYHNSIVRQLALKVFKIVAVAGVPLAVAAWFIGLYKTKRLR